MRSLIGLSAVSVQFQCSFSAVSVQFQSDMRTNSNSLATGFQIDYTDGFGAVSEQFQSSSETISRQFQTV